MMSSKCIQREQVASGPVPPSRWVTLTVCLMLAMSPAHVLAQAVQDTPSPRLVTKAQKPEDFVPKGWKLELQAKGDLNGDGRDDLVLVLRDNDPANVISHDGMCENPFDANPRILVVAFAQPDGRYTLALRNETLIPTRDTPCVDDMLQNGGVSISRGALRVTLSRFSSAGGWEMGSTTYTFRWQEGNFMLIGYDDSSVMRNSGEMRTLSVNFSTGKAKVSTGNAFKDGEHTQWMKLRTQRRWTLDQVGDGAEFGGTLLAIE
ncbi:hypothetical protein [Burkholderia ubonensis]|uniref:hypothetical protein n=1 Tax=Burkholderia ubonensis TaxID=101571 RepID=UPI00117813A1|nr:hypothetical protein [Burkholderia ubonensis]